MDLEDVGSSFQVRNAKLNLPVQSARPQQCRVQSVWAVCCHQHLHIAPGIEAVKLIDNLQHRTLHLAVTICLIASSRAADGVDLINEEDAGLLRPRQLEELSHHAGSLTDIALHQLGADDADEARVGAVGDCAGSQRLSSAGGAVQQHSLRRVDAQGHEALWLKQGHLDDLAQALQLLLGATDVVVRHVWLLLHGHHGDGRIDARRQGQLD
mmetsp:Transcript_83446/g.202367  ORF Transcript_83446/g.202367 Transcript_83446/m.202367 type:complete len:211 (+) Transcript_83446:433-1065(+)